MFYKFKAYFCNQNSAEVHLIRGKRVKAEATLSFMDNIFDSKGIACGNVPCNFILFLRVDKRFFISNTFTVDLLLKEIQLPLNLNLSGVLRT